MILVVVNHLSRPVVVLDGLLGLYGFKYDNATACGLPLYLYSYKLVSSTIATQRPVNSREVQILWNHDRTCPVDTDRTQPESGHLALTSS